MTNKGLGDTISNITEKTGIKKAVKMIFGDSCGCDERRKKLNDAFPNFKNIRPFTADEKKIYESTIPTIEKTQRITQNDRNVLGVLHKSVFKMDAKWSGCGSCNQKTITKLKRVYEKSCDE